MTFCKRCEDTGDTDRKCPADANGLHDWTYREIAARVVDDWRTVGVYVDDAGADESAAIRAAARAANMADGTYTATAHRAPRRDRYYVELVDCAPLGLSDDSRELAYRLARRALQSAAHDVELAQGDTSLVRMTARMHYAACRELVESLRTVQDSGRVSDTVQS